MEFCSEEFDALCRPECIVRHHKIVGTPQKNGVVECMNITIMEKVCCMLSNVKLLKSLWTEAVATACFLTNRSPPIAIDKKTPIEVWSSTPAVYSSLKIFCCPTYAYVDNGKLEPRSFKCVFLGYKNGIKGCKLWCSETHKIIISKNVIFDENAMLLDLPTNDSYETSQ